MNKLRLTILLGIILVLLFSKIPVGFAQNIHPPLKVPLVMSSSFCEPRSGHFHSGVDYKTQGRSGLNLYSVLDGELYRMKISAYGYGLALYIMHQDTCMSVYAHMSGFRSDIADFAKSLQYENQAFSLDTVFSEPPFSFKKGELIGYSGNSGSSFGPHLHFEIREWPSENVLNAQNYYPLKDNIAPDFFSVILYDIDRPDLSEEKRADRYLVSGYGDSYGREDLTLPAGNWGIGVEVKDKMNGTRNRYGVIEMKLFLDDLLVYHSEIESFDWNDNLIFESFFDAYYLERNSKYVQRCFREPSNTSKMLIHLENEGIIGLSEGETKAVKIAARDAAGNWSECNFNLKSVEPKPEEYKKPVMACKKSHLVLGEGSFLEIPEGAMYRNGNIALFVEESNEYGKMWHFSDPWFAFVKPYKLALDGSGIPQDYREKALLMWTRKGKQRRIEGEWQSAYYIVENNKAGSYYFEIDTVAPLASGGFNDSISLSYGQKIAYRISDDLSGIKSYNAWIDDKWVLLSYEPKTKEVFYKIDNQIEKSKWHNWKVHIEDARGNATESRFVFYY